VICRYARVKANWKFGLRAKVPLRVPRLLPVQLQQFSLTS